MKSTFIITSPNSQFSKMAKSVSEELEFEAIIIEAILEEAVERCLELCRDNNIAAIISRGGTAAMLKNQVSAPVLVAEASDFDILVALLEAAEYSKKVAYILSADYSLDELAWVAGRFKIIMQPYIFRNSVELKAAIAQAKADGHRVLMSGSDKARAICAKEGLTCVLVGASRRTMLELVRRAADLEKLEQRLRREAHSTGMAAHTTFKDMNLSAWSPAMRACLNRARQFAATESTVLITGESGVGKELMAESLHNGSRRRSQPFVAINCAALPLTLLESELFGYEEGAFTGARRGGKPGYFELAHGGTLFLDELGLLPLHVQMQLLRVLQSRQVLRVGGRKMIPVDVRVVAATNADLGTAVADGSFRQDLYYRINVLHIAIPPLRQRQEDIPLLISRYLPKYAHENGRVITGMDEELLAAFCAHQWPGNVRELLNYLMRLTISGQGPVLTESDLERCGIFLKTCAQTTASLEQNPAAIYNGSMIQLKPGSMESMEQDIIRHFMRRYGGKRNRVCEELGLSRSTLWKKLKEMGLEANW